MRRMIWLTAGAVLGIAGYRRLDRAAKSLTGSGPVTRQAIQVNQSQQPGVGSGGLRACAGLALGLATGTVRWAGALRARRVAKASLGGQGHRSYAGFLGDVRDGMEEYLDAHADRQVQAPRRREIGPPQI